MDSLNSRDFSPVHGIFSVERLPNDAFCTVCGQVLITQPNVVAYFQRNPERQKIVPMVSACRCRQETEQQRRKLLEVANLPVDRKRLRTFESFELVLGSEAAVEAARNFVEESPSGKDASPPILVLCGSGGSGKTHLLEAIGRAAIEQGLSVRYEHAGSLLVALRGSYGDGAPLSAWQIMDRCDKARILLLDDVGINKDTPWTVEHLTTLVDARYRMSRKLVVATNKSKEQMEADEVNFRLASRLYDTNSGLVNLVYMTCGDYRA